VSENKRFRFYHNKCNNDLHNFGFILRFKYLFFQLATENPLLNST
jgi:hypothetical protein